MVKAECIVAYQDLQLNKLVNIGEVLDLTTERAEYLVSRKLVKVLEVIPEEVKLEEVKEEAPVEVQEEVKEEPKKPVAKKNKRK